MSRITYYSLLFGCYLPPVTCYLPPFMSIAGTIDAPLELFGGLVTDMAAADLPEGVSPDCQDVAFLQGAVKTRPGLLSVYSPITGNPTVNYLKTFTQPNLVKTLLAIDSAGTLC
jgi:hypothetical protein